MRRGNLALTFVLLLAFGCRESTLAPPPEHLPGLKGFSYTSFTADGFTQGGRQNAIGNLTSQVNNTWISLVVFEYQSLPTSTEIGPNTTGINPLTGGAWSTSSTESDIREGIRQARLRDLHIMLKPHVDLYNGEWRAAIQPDDAGQWFSSYRDMMLKYARLSQELNVEMLCVGDEYIVATQHRYTAQWKRLISDIRSAYGGHLTYASNWNGAAQYGIPQPEFQQVEFWNDLDYIGVDMYYPLTTSASDSIPPFDTALQRMLANTSPYSLLYFTFRKPVIITETGIQSVQGALAAPWDYSLGAAPAARQDTAAQELYYRVMINAFGNQPWCAGVFWWHWESVPSPNAATNYTPQDKPAARIVKQWYNGIGA